MSPEDYKALYNSLSGWISDRRRQVSNRDLPSTVEGLQSLLRDFTESREREEPSKREQVQELKGMEAELRVFALKRKKNIDIPDSSDIEQVN